MNTILASQVPGLPPPKGHLLWISNFTDQQIRIDVGLLDPVVLPAWPGGSAFPVMKSMLNSLDVQQSMEIVAQIAEAIRLQLPEAVRPKEATFTEFGLELRLAELTNDVRPNRVILALELPPLADQA